MSSRPYVVKQGDILARLAHEYGFDVDQVWNDSANKELKKRRANPNMLLPGDVLYFTPKNQDWTAVSSGTTNKFSAEVPLIAIHVRFKDGDKALAGAQYVIEGLTTAPETTGSDGGIDVKVPITMRSFTVHFIDLVRAYEIKIGHLDPPDTPSGARMRLAALGVFSRECAEEVLSDEQVAAGLRSFQRANKLEVTGSLDEKTSKKLVELYGA